MKLNDVFYDTSPNSFNEPGRVIILTEIEDSGDYLYFSYENGTFACCGPKEAFTELTLLKDIHETPSATPNSNLPHSIST